MRDNDLRLRFVALDLDGKPIAGKRISGRAITARSSPRGGGLIGGFYAYENQMPRPPRCDLLGDNRLARPRAAARSHPGVSGEVYVGGDHARRRRQRSARRAIGLARGR
jgi:hypothetical protein